MTPPTDPDGYPIGLLEICQLLHMDNTGSGELEYGRYTRVKLTEYLSYRLANWESQRLSTASAYDDAVRALCLTVLAEKHWSTLA